MSKNENTEKIEVIDKGLSTFERFVNFFQKYSFWTIIKTLVLSIVIGYSIYIALNPEVVFSAYERWKKVEHTEAVKKAMHNSVFIQNELEVLRTKIGADRVILLTYHNTMQSLAGVPFIYLTAENEVIGDGVAPVAEGYERVKTSLYPFVSYLNKEGYFCGNIEDLRTIDKALAYRMEGNDVRHFAAMNIEGEQPLGVLFITYINDVNDSNIHNCSDTKNEIYRVSTKLAVLLSAKENNRKKTRV